MRWVVLCRSVRRKLLISGLSSARKTDCHLKNKPATASTLRSKTLFLSAFAFFFLLFLFCISVKMLFCRCWCVSFMDFRRHNEACVHNLKTNQPFICINHCAHSEVPKILLAGSEAHHFPPFKGFLSQWFVNRADDKRLRGYGASS